MLTNDNPKFNKNTVENLLWSKLNRPDYQQKTGFDTFAERLIFSQHEILAKLQAMQGHRSFAGFSVGSNLRLFKFIHGYAINICHIEGVKQAFKL